MRSRKTSWKGVFCGLALVAVAIVAGMRLLNQPNVGVVAEKGVESSEIKSPPAEKSWLSFEGKNVNFSYPAEFRLQEEVGPVKLPVIERVILHNAHDGKVKKIALTVETLPEGGLSELSAVRFRELSPKLYKKVRFSGTKKSGVFYESTQEMAEIIGFVAHEGRVTAVALTENGTTAEKLRSTFERLIEGLDWPK